MSKPKRMKMMEIKQIYYFVSASCPIMAEMSESETMETIKAAAENCVIDLTGGIFRCISATEENGILYKFNLYTFGTSKPASKAKMMDFTMTTDRVDVSEILCDVDQQMVHIDISLTTVSSANAVASATASSTASASTIAAYDMMLNLVKETVEETHVHFSALTDKLVQYRRQEELASVKQPALALESFQLPEDAYNAVVYYQVSRKATSLGFTVVDNESVIETSGKCSQYHHSRPDLIIFHQEKLHGYVVHAATQEEPSEPDECDLSLRGAVGESKLMVHDNRGQLVAEMDKVAGSIAEMYLRKNIKATEKKFRFIEVYGLLCDYSRKTCQVYKLKMDFKLYVSTLYEGRQELSLDEGISRLLATLKKDS